VGLESSILSPTPPTLQGLKIGPIVVVGQLVGKQSGTLKKNWQASANKNSQYLQNHPAAGPVIKKHLQDKDNKKHAEALLKGELKICSGLFCRAASVKLASTAIIIDNASEIASIELLQSDFYLELLVALGLNRLDADTWCPGLYFADKANLATIKCASGPADGNYPCLNCLRRNGLTRCPTKNCNGFYVTGALKSSPSVCN
jgi:hypothetical protein